jgi:hypothetical protein
MPASSRRRAHAPLAPREETAAPESLGDYGNAAFAEGLAPATDEGSDLLSDDLGPEDRGYYGVVQNDALDTEWAGRAEQLGMGAVKVRLKSSDALVPGDAMYDFIVSCREKGLEVVVLFNHESVGTDYAEPDLDRTRARAEEVVERLGGLASAWEVWNEPQSIEPTRDMSAEMLMRVLGTAYPVMAATGAPVLAAPEWCAGNADRFRHDMAVWWNANRGEYPEVTGEWPFDIMAVHAYFLEGWDPRALIRDSMAEIAEDFGPDMPVWVTEFGTAGYDEDSEREQAEFATDVAGAFGEYDNVDRMFWYSLRDYGGDESGAQMGLHREDGSQKPVADVWGHGKQPARGETPATAPAEEAPTEAPTEAPSGDFTAPYASLDAQFRAHAEALGAEPTAVLWDEWFPAYLDGEFLAHAEALGAEPSTELWDEWLPAWQQNAA